VEKELKLNGLKVDGPTPWMSRIVVVPKKSGEVRICIDMREANQTVKLEKHLMPTIDDLVADLDGATVFTTLDLSSGYCQLDSAHTSASDGANDFCSPLRYSKTPSKSC
jgi:hypothetical protein